MERMDTNPTKYVVFDVETNGLKSKKDDLLSISFYKPDDGKEYSKFLPLLSSHPNLSRVLCERPYIECHSTLVKSFEIDANGIEKFPTNFTGMTIEH
jgi:DNA polymerase III alpha subunit (gram-positive type)